MSEPPVSLYAEFTARDGHTDEVQRLVSRLVLEVRAEPGNVVFDAWVRTERPTEFVVFETYRDRAAFEEHLASTHCVDFNRALTPLVEGAGSTLTWLSPVGVSSS